MRFATRSDLPAFLSALARRFEHLHYGPAAVAEALAQCPGFDLTSAVQAAWEQVRLGIAAPGEQPLVAEKMGLPDAFTQAVIQLESGRISSSARQKQAREQAALAGYNGSPSNAPAWLSANLDHFQFDPGAQRYSLIAGDGSPCA